MKLSTAQVTGGYPEDPIAELAPTLELARERIGVGLRALVLFGSCLSPATRRAGSIPDLLALVDDLDATLVALGAGRMARWLAPLLPPITLSLRGTRGGAPLGKLNLAEPGVVAAAMATPRDLYFAGRLSKRTQVVWARDDAAAGETRALLDGASDLMASLALSDVSRRQPLDELVQRCLSLSYVAEPRPERPEKIRALFDAFADWYLERYRGRLLDVARARGLSIADGMIVDGRDESVRAEERRTLERLLRRSRRRMMARWPKQMLVYRGWLPYVLGKLIRARAH